MKSEMETYLICIWKLWLTPKGAECPVSQIYEKGNGALPKNNTDLVSIIMEVNSNTIDIMPGLLDFTDTVLAYCPLQKKECFMCLATTKNKAGILKSLAEKNGPALIKNFKNRTDYPVFSEFEAKCKSVNSVDTHVYFVSANGR